MHFIPFLFFIYNLLSFHLAALAASWWRWRKPKLRFVRCFAAFAFICPFCCRKRWTVRFRLPKKTNPNRKIGSGSSWWRWRKPKLRFVRCFAAFAFICPFCCRKRWTVRFRLPKKNEPKPKNRFRFVLVEMAVIETASENPSSMLSTSVGGLLSFPRRCADRQAHRFGIL